MALRRRYRADPACRSFLTSCPLTKGTQPTVASRCAFDPTATVGHHPAMPFCIYTHPNPVSAAASMPPVASLLVTLLGGAR
jgi:hypothetical protein